MALSRMSVKEGGEGGVLVNTASLAGVRVLQMLRPFMKTVTFVKLATTLFIIFLQLQVLFSYKIGQKYKSPPPLPT